MFLRVTRTREAAPPSAALGLLFVEFAGGTGRWPSYRVVANSWPQPRQAVDPRLPALSARWRFSAREGRGGAPRVVSCSTGSSRLVDAAAADRRRRLSNKVKQGDC
jgi:hypothetical protein